MTRKTHNQKITKINFTKEIKKLLYSSSIDIKNLDDKRQKKNILVLKNKFFSSELIFYF